MKKKYLKHTLESGHPLNLAKPATSHTIDKVTVSNFKENGNFDFNSDFINNQIKFKVGEKFNDSLRTLTLQNFNKLDLFSFPSVSYKYIENKNNSLEAAIILNSKKKYAIGFGFDIKQSNIEDIGISFENRFKTRNVFKNGENLELSATGSIGKSTLEIIRKDKQTFEILLLTTNNNYKEILKQINEFEVQNIEELPLRYY